MATNHTTNYELSQWLSADQVLRTDFNADNVKLDAALADLAESVAGKADQEDLTALSQTAAGKADQEDLEAVSAAVPKIAVGSYTGNGDSSRTISVGFTPKAVYVCTTAGLAYSPSASGYVYGGLAVTGSSAQHNGYTTLQVTSGGFTVYQRSLGSYSSIECNASGTKYQYVAIG